MLSLPYESIVRSNGSDSLYGSPLHTGEIIYIKSKTKAIYTLKDAAGKDDPDIQEMVQVQMSPSGSAYVSSSCNGHKNIPILGMLAKRIPGYDTVDRSIPQFVRDPIDWSML